MLAAKAAIATRVDALGEETNTDLGIEHRAKVETRICQLEGGQVSQVPRVTTGAPRQCQASGYITSHLGSVELVLLGYRLKKGYVC